MNAAPRRRPGHREATIEHRLAHALTQAGRHGIDVTHHRAAIERRLDAMTRRIAARDAAPHHPAQ